MCGTFFVGAMSHAMRRNAVYLRCITERAPPLVGRAAVRSLAQMSRNSKVKMCALLERENVGKA